MTEKIPRRVLFLENDNAVQKHAGAVLSKQGWDVICKQNSKDALNTLEQSKDSPFTLFISNFELLKTQGDDILQKVKSISPLTKKMLLMPADKPDDLVSHINKAQINACILLPFKDEDLVCQAKNCLQQFKYSLKLQYSKQAAKHQNKQLYLLAQKQKKKEKADIDLINNKKKQILELRSKKRKAENESKLSANISLSNIIEHKDVEAAPHAFKEQFVVICEIVKGLFDQVAAKHKSDPISLDLQNIIDTKKQDREEQDTKEQDTKENKSPLSELIEKILNTAFLNTISAELSGLSDSDRLNDNIQGADSTKSDDDSAKNKDFPDLTDSAKTDGSTQKAESVLDDYFDISISKDQLKAYITKIKDFDDQFPIPNSSELRDMLKQYGISHGLLDDEAIKAWLLKSSDEKIAIASGEKQVEGHNGKIKYFFKTNFTNPGKLREDGSIDFRERGDIPYVNKGYLLAQKTPLKEGKPGINISGDPVLCAEVLDPAFTAGNGTKISEDELSIHADIDGQPHCDALGNISVNSELIIEKDVDFETGNIDFKGNIVVKGMIKEGFLVKGMNLTVTELEGCTIDLTGDLSVSAGITNATITTHGNIYAKFINQSEIKAFGNLVISKEIIDSNLFLSGSCQNADGHIISSQISAKMGIEANKIGTSSSQPVKIRIGIDEHIDIQKKQNAKTLKASVDKANLLKNEIQKLNAEDQELYQQITEKAQTQDLAQNEIKKLKTLVTELEKSKDSAKLQQALVKMKNLNKKAANAEQELQKIFKAQDTIAKKIEKIEDQINTLEEQNKAMVIGAKALTEFSDKTEAKPLITIAKDIVQGSSIIGPNSSIVLKEDASRCKIQEIIPPDQDVETYEMDISSL